MTKEIEVTNVLNLQQNAVIIFSESKETVVGAEALRTPTIQFANIKSAELFKIDLERLNARACLSLQQLVPLNNTLAEVYENNSPRQE